MYILGEDCKIGISKNIKERIESAFLKLVEKVYYHKNMIKGKVFSEDEIDMLLIQEPILSLSEPENNINQYIKECKSKGENVSLQNLIDKFVGIPYGWTSSAVLCFVSTLYARQLVDIKNATGSIDKNEIAKSIKNDSLWGSIIVRCSEQIDTKSLSQMTQFVREFFNATVTNKDAKELANLAFSLMRDFSDKLKKYQSIAQKYCFNIGDKLNSIVKTLDIYVEEAKSDPLSLYKSFLSETDNLVKEYVELEPLIEFFNSSDNDKGNFKKYINALDVVKNDSSYHWDTISKEDTKFTAVADAFDALKAQVFCDSFYIGSQIRKTESLLNKYNTSYEQLLDTMKVEMLNRISNAENLIKSQSTYTKLSPGGIDVIDAYFNEKKKDIDSAKTYTAINGLYMVLGKIYDNVSKLLLNLVNQDQIKSTPVKTEEEHLSPDDALSLNQPTQDITSNSIRDSSSDIKMINIEKCKISFNKMFIESQEDLKEYLNQLEAEIKDKIDNGYKILIPTEKGNS